MCGGAGAHLAEIGGLRRSGRVGWLRCEVCDAVLGAGRAWGGDSTACACGDTGLVSGATNKVSRKVRISAIWL